MTENMNVNVYYGMSKIQRMNAIEALLDFEAGNFTALEVGLNRSTSETGSQV